MENLNIVFHLTFDDFRKEYETVGGEMRPKYLMLIQKIENEGSVAYRYS